MLKALLRSHADSLLHLSTSLEPKYVPLLGLPIDLAFMASPPPQMAFAGLLTL